MITPKTQPIASAMKSYILPYLLMNMYFCNNSVSPPYEIDSSNVNKKGFFLILVFWYMIFSR